MVLFRQLSFRVRRPLTSFQVQLSILKNKTMAAELFSALTNPDTTNFNLEVAELQADLISTTGQLLAFFGPILGGTVFGAIAAVIAIGAVIYSNDLRRQIDLERYLRGTTTPGPTIPTTLDPSKIQQTLIKLTIHNRHFFQLDALL